MPLDSGAVTPVSPGTAGAAVAHSTGQKASAFDQALTIGGVLRTAREARGMSLQDLAEATRVRRSYLAALEEMKLEQLPSRPFTIGYVRAAAQVLGLDPDDAVRRFKADAPDPAEPLRAPVGVSRERDPRLSLLAGGVALVLGAVLVWNLAQHAVAQDGDPVSAVPEVIAPSAGPLAAPAGAVMLSQARPAPQESQVPPPYETPGLLQASLPEGTGPDAAAVVPAPPPGSAKAVAPPAPAARPNPRAAVYGAAAGQSVVTLRARKPASLIIRGSDGSVYFARQLAAGEGYRAPRLQGLSLETSDPSAFDVYANGQFTGQLPAPQISVAKLEG